MRKGNLNKDKIKLDICSFATFKGLTDISLGVWEGKDTGWDL